MIDPPLSRRSRLEEPSAKSGGADIVLAAIVGVTVVIATIGHAGGAQLVPLKAYATMGVGIVALAMRRRFPVAAVTVAGVSTAYYYIGPFPDGPEMITFAIASYLAAANEQRVAAYTGTVAGLAIFAWGEFLIGPPHVGRFVGVLAWVLVVLCAGEVTRYHRAYLSEARWRATEERPRIARELHDVLAHKISTPDRRVRLQDRTLSKLGARDRAQLVVLAYESGMVRPGWLG